MREPEENAFGIGKNSLEYQNRMYSTIMIFAFADTDVAYWLFEFRNGNRARAAATGKM